MHSATSVGGGKRSYLKEGEEDVGPAKDEEGNDDERGESSMKDRRAHGDQCALGSLWVGTQNGAY